MNDPRNQQHNIDALRHSQSEVESLRARIAELEAGLREYGRHHWQCNAFNPTERDRIEGRDKCDCDAQIANRLLGEGEK